MIGGKVVGVSARPDGLLLTVEDGTDQRAIRCDPSRNDGSGVAAVRVGDDVWVQGRLVLWTPTGADHSGKTPRVVGGVQTYDIELPRIF